MWNKRRPFTICFCLLTLLQLMVDPATALAGASAGIEQSYRVIIPSLFPYFFLTTYLNSQLLGLQIPAIRFLTKRLQIPKGAESILLLGLIGGYPVGAQAVANACKKGAVKRNCAHILLGYCNNAGPAFIFGVAGALFLSPFIPWILWLIQIVSILITGYLLPRPYIQEATHYAAEPITLISALKQSIQITTSVCGWIIIFKVILSYLTTPFSQLPDIFRILVSGILELSNGCLDLHKVPSYSARFLLCSAFLSFGGLCVLMQTKSAVGNLGLGYYFPGKVIQTSVSFLLSLPISYVLFQESLSFRIWLPVTILLSFLIVAIGRYAKKNNGGNLAANHI